MYAVKSGQSGIKVLLVNDAEIVHLGGGSSNSQSNRLFSTILMRESNYLFQKKFRGPAYALTARGVFLLAGLLRIAGMISLPFSCRCGPCFRDVKYDTPLVASGALGRGL